MKFYEYINEKLLHSEFKIGFEFECILRADKDGYPDDAKHDLDVAINQFFPELKSSYNFQYDTSLEGDNEDDYENYGDLGFEFISPPMNFTPETFKKILGFLNQAISSDKIYTNETCGFHVHMSFPRMNDLDAAWIVTYMASSNSFLEAFKKLENFDFLNDEYAHMENIEALRSNLISWANKDRKGPRHFPWEMLDDYITTEKYNLIRIHPQGTLEWRGPRNFMNKGEVRYIKDFLKLLWQYISFISDAMNHKKLPLPKIDITKKEFYENMNHLVLFNKTQDKIKNKEERKFLKFKNEILKKAIKLPWVYEMFKNEYDHDLWKRAYDSELDFQIENDKDCIWNSGLWSDADWYGGNFYGGRFYGATWHDGTFVDGVFSDSMFRGGRWFGGKFQDNSMWVEGEIYSTKFNKYIKSSIAPPFFYEMEKKYNNVKAFENELENIYKH